MSNHLCPPCLWLSLFVGCHFAACTATQPSSSRHAAGPELPVTRVILYQNGIGYFERRGEVNGQALSLQVRPEQINDMLKSLTVVDTRAGRAVSVSLPLEKRSADQLAELPEQVRNAGGLLQVLAVFRGAEVTVEGDKGSAKGRIIGVEAFDRSGSSAGEPGGQEWRLTLKDREEALVVYPVNAIERVQINEPTLSAGLNKSLDVALDAGNWKPITLSVRLAGETPHPLIVAYITEMPVWKPTYRVVLGDQGTSLLQGWAVVDNVSGEDWNNVRLSLVAGNPVSFKYDLHSPQFTSRVDLTPQHRRMAMAPAVERAGMAASPSPPPSPMAPAAMSGAGGMVMPRPSMAKRSRAAASEPYEAKEDYATTADTENLDYNLGAALEQQVPAAATGESVGALFRYDIVDPVTVPDGTSNLVSIVNARVKGQEVVLFRPGDRDETGMPLPYRSVRLENATDSTLERGPVAIYSGTTFLGEGFVDRMEKGTTTFLTYAADGGVHLTQSQTNSDEGGRLLKIMAGMIESEVISVIKQRLAIKNDHDEEITAYVKTAKLGGDWKLTTKPAETVETGAALFFPVKAAPHSEGTLEVTWQQPIVRRIGIDTDLSTTVLKLYLGSGKIPKEIAGPINEILALKQKIVDNTHEYSRLKAQHDQLSADQDRVRENLNLLRKTAGNRALMDQLTEKLASLELDLGRLSGKLVRLSEENADLQRKMEATIRSVSLDNTGKAS